MATLWLGFRVSIKIQDSRFVCVGLWTRFRDRCSSELCVPNKSGSHFRRDRKSSPAENVWVRLTFTSKELHLEIIATLSPSIFVCSHVLFGESIYVDPNTRKFFDDSCVLLRVLTLRLMLFACVLGVFQPQRRGSWIPSLFLPSVSHPTNTNVCALHRVEVSKIMRTFFWQEHTLTLCFVCLVETCFLNKNKILSCSCSNTTIAFALIQKNICLTLSLFFDHTDARRPLLWSQGRARQVW